MTENTRAAIQKLVGESKVEIARQMEDFWRRWVEDLIAGGVCQHTVIEAMLVVGMAQCVRIAGTTVTGNYLERCAEKLHNAADGGVEFPAPDVVRH